MRRGLAFLSEGRPAAGDYGSRLARLRWLRAVGEEGAVIADWGAGEPAAAVVREAESWVLVPDAEALPFALPRGAAHTLRELESGPARPDEEGSTSPVAFRPAELPPAEGETVELYIKRLYNARPAGFEILPSCSVGDPSAKERPEVVDRLPAGACRILDPGCGSGGLALARARRPAWKLTGIENDPIRAARARETRGYERILEGDIVDVVPALSAEGARFDVLVFADVLEHFEDPVPILAAARSVVEHGGLLLVVAPNVGHLSLVRDLLLGRHDPVPAGLCDWGHLRWFSKSFLAETIEEAGWHLEKIEGIPGAAPPDPEPFLALARSWPEADLESLATYQWIATARNR